MDGVAAVRSVLLADAAMMGLVPAASLVAGMLPLGFALNAVSIQSVSKVDRNIPAPGAARHVRERVQVTVHARNYPQQKELLRAVRHAAADRINPVVVGISAVTIHTDSAGADFVSEDAAIWMGTQDFLVTYTEQR